MIQVKALNIDVVLGGVMSTPYKSWVNPAHVVTIDEAPPNGTEFNYRICFVTRSAFMVNEIDAAMIKLKVDELNKRGV